MTPDEELARFHHHCQQEIVKTLVATIGECLTADPYATSTLLLKRGVECNEALAMHPYVPVTCIGGPDNPGYMLSALGLLNAVVEKLTGCMIVTTYTEAMTETGVPFERITAVELVPKAKLVADGIVTP